MKSFKMLVVLAVLLQFGILGWMIYTDSLPARTGRVITVQTVPVDPRDLFRGDYVILNYEFNQPQDWRYRMNKGYPMYAILKKSPDSEIWVYDKIVSQRPTPETLGEDRIYLAGISRWWRVEYGIEQFFVQEGKGKDLEKAMRWTSEEEQTPVLVDLYVTADGRAAVKEARFAK